MLSVVTPATLLSVIQHNVVEPNASNCSFNICLTKVSSNVAFYFTIVSFFNKESETYGGYISVALILNFIAISI